MGKSNAYVGLDQKMKVKLTTLDNSVLEEYKVHPDDAELDDEPTLFEEMLNANVEEDSDDDSDDSDDESDDDDDQGNTSAAIAPKSEADMKKDRLKNARNQDDDSDSDDDDAEEVYAD